MAKKSTNQIIAIILLIAFALFYVNVPFLDEGGLAKIAVLGCAIWLLVKG